MEDVKKELEGLKSDVLKAVETKSQEEVNKHLDAFTEKYKETLAEDAKLVFETHMKSLKEEMTTNDEALQKHLDDLDIRLKGVTKKTKNDKKSFAQILGEELTEKTDEIAKFQRKETSRLSLELKAPEDMTTGNVTGTRYGELFNPNIIDRPSRQVHMSQILPSGSIGPGNSFTHMREVGSVNPYTTGEGNPAPVAEGADKPQFDYDLTESTVQIETVAGFMRVTRKAMSNIPGFISFLQRRIPDRFMRVLDNQFLYGDGITPNIKGILTAGNFVNQGPEALKVSEKLIKYISLFEDTYERVANGILLRPATYYSMFTEQASGSGEYDLPFGVTLEGGVVRVLGVPVFTTTALNAADIVVGDWANGAQILTQEQMRIEFFEQDANNVTQNKVTVRVEGNYALPVYGDDFFIKGTTAQS